MSLAERTNAIPLDPIPETFGVRLPPAKHCLTGINFDLVPNKKLQSNASDGDEEEDDDDDDDDRMDEEAGSRVPSEGALAVDLDGGVRMEEDENDSNGSADDDPDGLFDDDGDEEEGEMALVDIDALNGLVGMAGPQAGEKRKVNPEDDDYDE